MSTITLIITLLFNLHPLLIRTTQAETISSQLPWSKSLCADLGYQNEFDFCGQIEFCDESSNVDADDACRRRRHRRRGRRLRGLQSDYYREIPPPPPPGYDEHNDDYDEADSDGTSEECASPARYGFRLPGQRCTYPAPLIRLERNATYGLFLKGAGESSSTLGNIHPHGLHIAGHGNADDVSRRVGGNDVIIYEWRIPEYHMGGTHWYHSHVHGQTAEQVSGGAFGMLIVEDGDNVGSDEEGVKAFLKNEKILFASSKKDRWVANGSRRGVEKYEFAKGEWYRLRILTLNFDDHQDHQTLKFGDGCTVHAVAHDGILRFQVPKADPQTTFSMGVSSRLDVAIKCDEDSTIAVNSDTVVEINVSSDETTAAATPAPTPFEKTDQQWSSTRPQYLADLRSLPVDSTWQIKLDETNINDKQYSPTEPLCVNGRDLKYDTVTEWVISNSAHPLHAHVYPMQIANSDCGEHDVGEYYDILTANGDFKKKCNVRLHLVDVAGKMVVHCHIYTHGDQGSMGFLNVVGGPTQREEPRVHFCSQGNKTMCDVPVSVNLCGTV